MKKLLLFLLLLASPVIAQSDAYLTVGQNYNFVLGDGGGTRLDITQSLWGPVSLLPHGSFDSNEGFRDRSGGLDVSYAVNPKVSVLMGAQYEKYELLGVPPTETHDVHTAVRIKLW
jgi:hypothetical protein